eukprot:6064300-Pleurochrysis_carterae.AAC.9
MKGEEISKWKELGWDKKKGCRRELEGWTWSQLERETACERGRSIGHIIVDDPKLRIEDISRRQSSDVRIH